MEYFREECYKTKLKFLKNKIDSINRVKLAALPTPLIKLDNLTNKISGPEIYIKRDDLTGLGLGGNKIRMLEFSIAKALETKSDCVIGTASVQSNYCRQLSAAAAKVGLETYLVLSKRRGKQDLTLQGNYLLDKILGANTELINPLPWEELVEKIDKVKKKLLDEGKKPHVMRAVNIEDNWLDSMGYVNCFLEMLMQFKDMNIFPEYIFVTGSDTNQAGLLAAQKFLNVPINIVAISPSPQNESRPVGGKKSVKRIVNRISQEIQLDISINENEIDLSYDYVGKGYGIPTDACREAIRLMAELEGIFLDPVYSGKGFSGLIDFIRKKYISPKKTVVFIHTGGSPALFAYNEEFK